MKKLFEKSAADTQHPYYLGIWSFCGHTFKITSTLTDSTSTWRIDVRTSTGKWTFETGNLIFDNTPASYTIADVSINIQYAFDYGINIAEEYIKAVYTDKCNQARYKNINKSEI